MFLSDLNKDEAVSFLSLVKNIAELDGMFEEGEYKLINEYKEELGLKDEEVNFVNRKEALKRLEDSSKKVRAGIYFELLGFALVDGRFDNEEVAFLYDVEHKLGISRSVQKACLDFFKEAKEIYKSAVEDFDEKLRESEKKVECSIMNG